MENVWKMVTTKAVNYEHKQQQTKKKAL